MAAEQHDDRALLLAWASGDKTAGDAAMRRFFPLLWRYFRNKADHDVDDLIQATLASCVRHRDKLLQAASVRAYLFSMARNELYRHLRTRPDFDPLTHSVAAAQTSPSGQAAARDARARLREALRELPCVLQETVELHLDEELRGPELADALGVPEGTVRSRLRRAKAMLTERLGDAGPRLPET